MSYSSPTFFQRAMFRLGWWACLAFLTVFFRARRFHMERVPRTGAVILAANHQSHLDPPLVGVCNPWRPTHFLARAGLFKNRFFGWLIATVNSIPVSEDSGDIGAIKQILARLEVGVPVLIFPEGSRSPDGEVHEFKRGIALLLKRAKCPVVPFAVEGCFEAWPRNRRFPILWGRRIAVMAGEPIAPEELLKDGADAGLQRLRGEIERMRLELRAKLRAGSSARAKYNHRPPQRVNSGAEGAEKCID